jgi:hypothetical protein
LGTDGCDFHYSGRTDRAEELLDDVADDPMTTYLREEAAVELLALDYAEMRSVMAPMREELLRLFMRPEKLGRAIAAGLIA